MLAIPEPMKTSNDFAKFESYSYLHVGMANLTRASSLGFVLVLVKMSLQSISSFSEQKRLSQFLANTCLAFPKTAERLSSWLPW